MTRNVPRGVTQDIDLSCLWNGPAQKDFYEYVQSRHAVKKSLKWQFSFRCNMPLLYCVDAVITGKVLLKLNSTNSPNCCELFKLYMEGKHVDLRWLKDIWLLTWYFILWQFLNMYMGWKIFSLYIFKIYYNKF